MDFDLSSAWMMIFGMGIFHGINPGMGWLFAVGLGLQEQQRRAVWAALLPLAVGHALAIAAVIGVSLIAGLVIPIESLKWPVVACLFVFGVYRAVSHRHPRYGGMQVGTRELTIWSFLMGSAHGAGLMVLPFFLGAASTGWSHAPHSPIVTNEATPMSHAQHAMELLQELPPEPVFGLLATLLHTGGYLLIMGMIAVVVYEKLGLRLLRKAWINLDLIWSVILIATGVITAFM